MNVCIHICVYMCIYVYIYIYIFTCRLKHLTRSLLVIYNPEGKAQGIYIANKLRVRCLSYLYDDQGGFLKNSTGKELVTTKLTYI